MHLIRACEQSGTLYRARPPSRHYLLTNANLFLTTIVSADAHRHHRAPSVRFLLPPLRPVYGSPVSVIALSRKAECDISAHWKRALARGPYELIPPPRFHPSLQHELKARRLLCPLACNNPSYPCTPSLLSLLPRPSLRTAQR